MTKKRQCELQDERLRAWGVVRKARRVAAGAGTHWWQAPDGTTHMRKADAFAYVRVLVRRLRAGVSE